MINFAVFVIWKRPEMWRFMNRYFLLSAGHPKSLSVFGSIASHQNFAHVAGSIGLLLAIGIPLHEELTRGPFVAVYLSTGIIGALTSLTLAVIRKDKLFANLGASGAVMGLFGAWFGVVPWRKLGFHEWSMQYPTALALFGFVAWEVWGMWKTRKMSTKDGGTNYLAHIAGLLSGAGAGYWIRHRAEGNIKFMSEHRVGVDRLSVEDGLSKDGRDAVERVQ